MITTSTPIPPPNRDDPLSGFCGVSAAEGHNATSRCDIFQVPDLSEGEQTLCCVVQLLRIPQGQSLAPQFPHPWRIDCASYTLGCGKCGRIPNPPAATYPTLNVQV